MTTKRANDLDELTRLKTTAAGYLKDTPQLVERDEEVQDQLNRSMADLERVYERPKRKVVFEQQEEFFEQNRYHPPAVKSTHKLNARAGSFGVSCPISGSLSIQPLRTP